MIRIPDGLPPTLRGSPLNGTSAPNKPVIRELSEGLEPFSRREFLEFLVVPLVRSWRRIVADKRLHKIHEDASNGMNCIMPVQAFAPMVIDKFLVADMI